MSKRRRTEPVIEATGPTPEFRRHHDVAPPRIDRQVRIERWSITSRFIRLNPDDATIAAAERFYRDFAIAFGVRERSAVAGASRSGGITDARVIAAHNLRGVREAIGGVATWLVTACCVWDMTWTDIGHVLQCDREIAPKYTRAALAALVAYYATE